MNDTVVTLNHRFRMALLISASVIVVLAIFLSFDLIQPGRTSCDSIFQQTENQLSLKLKHLNIEGGFILGRQQVQSLTEQAQITALNLKSCCVALDSGALDDDRFLACRGSAAQFEGRLAALSERVDKLAAARGSGDVEAQQAEQTEIDRLLEEAKAVATDFSEQVSRIERPTLKATDDGFFFDDFDSVSLDSAWEIRHPDPDRWALQGTESTLLIVTQKGSMSGERDDLKNQFILNYVMPETDFVIETRVDIAIQNQKNGASLGLWQDADNFIKVGYFGFSHGYNVRRSPYFLKEVRGQSNYNEADVGRIGSVTEMETVFLRIEREGNKFIGAYAFGDVGEDASALQWNIIATHAIPNFRGRPSIWADNSDGKVYSTGNSVSPEVPVEFSYLSIR